ncbi:hypothetical protein BPNPMPFG_002351 [Mesorhizobium sp. AR07]|uniref:hypothetical protein n=1 Tax=Mesorhizobium sp. AR07 TaxID=2865838 RepID=UPI00215FDC91|nr:hypothetical protein [Mesorhizobium sp. AR07]UVK46658.1 hypothetical protein BPNPMPFG_002351 [Mesorhizobium sp. AR07]
MGRRLAQASVFALMVDIGSAGLTNLAQLLIACLIGPRNFGISVALRARLQGQRTS